MSDFEYAVILPGVIALLSVNSVLNHICINKKSQDQSSQDKILFILSGPWHNW